MSRLIYFLVFTSAFLLFAPVEATPQSRDYDSILAKATLHRQNQLMAHTILWGYYDNIGTQEAILDQKTNTITRLREDGVVIEYDIQLIGTYRFKDSSFILSTEDPSINKTLTRALTKVLDIAHKNKWPVKPTGNIRTLRNEITDLQTLAMYFDGANGMEYYSNLGTKAPDPTSLFYLFYNMRIRHKQHKLIKLKVDNKPLYTTLSDTALINFGRSYINEYNDNESKYMDLYLKNKQERRFTDTMFTNRRIIARKYWDTTSHTFEYHDANGPHIPNYKQAINWRVITIQDTTKYVVFEEPGKSTGNIVGLEIRMLNGKPAIENIYLNFY